MDEIKLPKLSEEEAKDLGRPISMEEFLEALTCIKSEKSPRPDGYTAIY